MIRTLALIACLAGAAHGSSSYAPSLRVGYDTDLANAFFQMPLHIDDAKSQGWVEYSQPPRPEGYSSLVMTCPLDDLTICTLYDDTGFISGVQIALTTEYMRDPVYDFVELGCTEWTATFPNGTSYTYWTHNMYFMSADELATSAETRVANRNSSRLLQYEMIWVSGPGRLYAIPTNADPGSEYTKEACIDWMGQHYLRNFSTSMGCTADTMFAWFPMLDPGSSQLVSIGLMYYVDYFAGNTYFKHPSSTVAEEIVPTGPECFYKMADTPGIPTVHIYFVDTPTSITC